MADLTDPKALEAFIILCKKHSIVQARVGEVELHFGYPVKFDATKALEMANALSGATMTNEEALFGSAPQFASQEQVEAALAAMRGEGTGN
jgi:hypothetical protein